MERLLSIKEASEILGLSSWTIRRWIQVKKLIPVRLGSRVLLEERELRRVVEEGKQRSAARPSGRAGFLHGGDGNGA